MTRPEDPRITVTRNLALDAALGILQDKGVLAVTHGAVSKATGFSRSTLYRHWSEISQLRNDAFKRAATPPQKRPPKTNGPLRADLLWTLSYLMSALNETPWGQIAPQVIAAAATDAGAREVINDFMKDRITTVSTIFAAAEARGEIPPGVAVQNLVEMAISVPYFRKLVIGLPLNQQWLESHVELICKLAESSAPLVPNSTDDRSAK